MKNQTTIILLMTSLLMTPMAFASDEFCVARVHNNISPGSARFYSVDCGHEKFETPKILTSFWIPLPYNWNAVAKKRLNTAMAKRNIKLVATIKSKNLINESFDKSFSIFGTSNASQSVFCIVTLSNQKVIGTGVKHMIADVLFEYSSPSFKSELYTGLNQAEIEGILLKDGFEKTNVSGLYKRGH